MGYIELLYLQELGVYKAVYPQELFYSEFVEEFCDSIVKRISAYDRSRARTINNGIQNGRVMVHKNKIYATKISLSSLFSFGTFSKGISSISTLKPKTL